MIVDGNESEITQPLALVQWDRYDVMRMPEHGRIIRNTFPRSSLTIDVTDVATDGSAAVQVARLLANGLANFFGLAELPQLGDDGSIRRATFSPSAHVNIDKWGRDHNVRIV